jgi:parallel beta-helix repeat protein
MHSWIGVDGVDIFEFNSNFDKLDSALADLGQNPKWYGAKGDGIADDTAEIQTALDKCKINGGIVRIPAGTYKITAPLIIYSNTWLSLASGATIQRGSNQDNMLRNGSDGTVGGYLANQNILITGGVWDANKAAYPTYCTIMGFGHMTNLIIRDAIFRNLYDWHMIEVNSTKNGHVQFCRFENYGTATTGTEMLQIDCMHDSVLFPWFGPYDSTMCQDITIEGCTFVNGVTAIGSHSSYDGLTHKNIRIINNWFETMSKEAVKTLNYEEVNVSNNVFTDCWKGLIVTASTNGQLNGFNISNNQFLNINRDSNSRALQVIATATASINNGIIEGNRINLCARHGIGIDYGKNWTVKGNNVVGCSQAGLWLFSTKKVTVVGNTLNGNNTSATTSRYDLNIGYNTPNTEDVMVNANIIGSVGVSGVKNVTLTNNIFDSYIEEVFSGAALLNIVKDNNTVGSLRQDSRGTITIPAGSTSVLVDHGLVTTPTRVLLTPRANVGAIWATSLNATQFTVSCSVAAPAGGAQVNWEARISN